MQRYFSSRFFNRFLVCFISLNGRGMISHVRWTFSKNDLSKLW